MNSGDGKLNKFFIFQMIFLNLLILIFIVSEIVKLSKFIQIENELSNFEKELEGAVNQTNLEDLDGKYLQLANSLSTENSLGDLINFIEFKTQEFNLKIKETKFLNVTEADINYEIVVEGDLENIANFMREIESDRSIKQILNTTLNFNNNIPSVKILIKSIKI